MKFIFILFIGFISFQSNAFSDPSFSPSVEAQSVAKTVLLQRAQGLNKTKLKADFGSARIEWRKSNVDNLFYGVFWLKFTLPDRMIVLNPSRFYVQDKGRGSMVIIGSFSDVSGRVFDASSVRTKLVSLPSTDVIKNKGVLHETSGFPLNKNAIVKKGKDRVVVFTDPDCPYCKKTRPALLKLATRKNIQLEIYYTPIDSLHPNARAKSKALLQLKPSQRLKAEDALYSLNSGDMATIMSTLANSGFYPDKKYVASSERDLIFGEDLAAKYGLRGTPNILIPSTRKAIRGMATESDILEKLR